MKKFLLEYPEAEHGYVVYQTPRKFQLGKNVTAIPWQEIGELLLLT